MFSIIGATTKQKYSPQNGKSNKKFNNLQLVRKYNSSAERQ